MGDTAERSPLDQEGVAGPCVAIEVNLQVKETPIIPVIDRQGVISPQCVDGQSGQGLVENRGGNIGSVPGPIGDVKFDVAGTIFPDKEVIVPRRSPKLVVTVTVAVEEALSSPSLTV